MIIFLILEHAIAKWYSYQPSIIISNPSPSVIHHLQSSIIITYRSSWVIHHHQSPIDHHSVIGSSFSHLSLSITYQWSIIITSSIIIGNASIIRQSLSSSIYHMTKVKLHSWSLFSAFYSAQWQVWFMTKVTLISVRISSFFLCCAIRPSSGKLLILDVVIFLILERVIRQSFTRQVIYSTDDVFSWS